MNAESKTYQFRALTDIWTGSAEIKEKNGRLETKTINERLINTGLLGSVRWWFEVLVRGLGGSACDPTDNSRCPDYEIKKATASKHHCVVCELFGCTDWARKYRFEVLDEKGEIKRNQIKKEMFSICFTPLRPVREEEWALLDATLRLIAEYGAIGGKTVLKPSDEPKRMDEPHHKDYGLVAIISKPSINNFNRPELETYVTGSQWRKIPEDGKKDYAWASLKNHWFVDKYYLKRKDASESSFNEILGRKESKACRDCGSIHNPPEKCSKTNNHPKRVSEQMVNGSDNICQWLAGTRQESKKVFSFKNHARTFGFVNPGLIDYAVMKQKLSRAWEESGWDFLDGDKILNRLFAGKEDRP